MSAGIEPPHASEVPSIEASLAELWRHQENSGEAVIRAALWNVVAHTDNVADMTFATEVLGRAAASVPQRTIIIRAMPDDEEDLSSWISANCHLLDGEKQVCSEQISIAAGGRRVSDVPSLVNALLIPDMPVAAWWIGDLPAEGEEYVGTLLEAADRLIVDSQHFDGADDLALLSRIASSTSTLPVDLNWMRLEDWRIATASIFDPPAMRPRLRTIRSVRLSCCGGSRHYGHGVICFYFAAWLSAQAGHRIGDDGSIESDAGEVAYTIEDPGCEGEGLVAVEIEFADGSKAGVRHDVEAGALRAVTEGCDQSSATVTRVLSRKSGDLVIAELSHMHEDRLFPRILPIAKRLSERPWA